MWNVTRHATNTSAMTLRSKPVGKEQYEMVESMMSVVNFVRYFARLLIHQCKVPGTSGTVTSKLRGGLGEMQVHTFAQAVKRWSTEFNPNLIPFLAGCWRGRLHSTRLAQGGWNSGPSFFEKAKRK